MTKLIRDPHLDELVKELNQHHTEDEMTLPSWPPALIPSGNPIEGLLMEMARRGASDLLILAGTHPIYRVAGRLTAGDRAALSSDDVHALLGTFLTSRVRERVEADGSADFSVRLSKPATEDDRRAWRQVRLARSTSRPLTRCGSGCSRRERSTVRRSIRFFSSR